VNNKFHPDELVNMKGKVYPVVGGRLRLAHEDGIDGITTQLIRFEPDELAVVSARVTLATEKESRPFTGHGVASAKKDARLRDSLLELAETRAIARALRFAGYGVEYTGAEEIGQEGPMVSPNAQKKTASKMTNAQIAEIKQEFATVDDMQDACTKMGLEYNRLMKFLKCINIPSDKFPKDRCRKMAANPEESKKAILEGLERYAKQD